MLSLWFVEQRAFGALAIHFPLDGLSKKPAQGAQKLIDVDRRARQTQPVYLLCRYGIQRHSHEPGLADPLPPEAIAAERIRSQATPVVCQLTERGPKTEGNGARRRIADGPLFSALSISLDSTLLAFDFEVC